MRRTARRASRKSLARLTQLAGSKAATRWDIYFLGMRLAPEREVRFHPERKWRFDVAFSSVRVAVEVNGGSWTGGRHTRGAGYIKDLEKLNHAQLLGWRVFQFTPDQVKSGQARLFVERAISAPAP